MALEIERLHKIAIHITDKYNDKIEQLNTTCKNSLLFLV